MKKSREASSQLKNITFHSIRSSVHSRLHDIMKQKFTWELTIPKKNGKWKEGTAFSNENSVLSLESSGRFTYGTRMEYVLINFVFNSDESDGQIQINYTHIQYTFILATIITALNNRTTFTILSKHYTLRWKRTDWDFWWPELAFLEEWSLNTFEYTLPHSERKREELGGID